MSEGWRKWWNMAEPAFVHTLVNIVLFDYKYLLLFANITSPAV
jgi:hypothetical protein